MPFGQAGGEKITAVPKVDDTHAPRIKISYRREFDVDKTTDRATKPLIEIRGCNKKQEASLDR